MPPSSKRPGANLQPEMRQEIPPIRGELTAAVFDEELSILASRGGLYLGIRYGLGILIGCGNMLVLTRWIGPHAYGLFVTAVGLTAFLASLARAGVDTYLVRMEPTPNERTYNIASSLIMGFSIVLVCAGAAAGPLLVHWYGNREFLLPYLVTLLTVPLAGLAGPPTAKLERELNFKAVAGIELGGQILSLMVSISCAWIGFGVWAPIAGLFIWQLWAAAGALRMAKLCLRPQFEADEARRMLSFGMGYTASLRVWQLRTLVNPLLVGRFAGAEAVAFVAFAIRVAEGFGFIRAAAGRIAIATLSWLRTNPGRFQATLQRALNVQILALGPLLCLFSLLAPTIVPTVMGARWSASLQVYPFVAAGVLVNALYNLQASALFVMGEQWAVLRAYLLHVFLLGCGTWLLLPRWGIRGYGGAELLACGGYAVLHLMAKGITRVSYQKLGWLTFAFLAPPFGLLIGWSQQIVLWTPLFVLGLIKLSKSRLLHGRKLGSIDSAQPIAALSPLASEFSDTGT